MMRNANANVMNALSHLVVLLSTRSTLLTVSRHTDTFHTDTDTVTP